MFDINMIRKNSKFYEQLKPKTRQKLVKELFSSFYQNFIYMFQDDDFGFGSSKEFMCEFITNLYSRIFTPGEIVMHIGETFPEMYMIIEGMVIMKYNYEGNL